MAGAVSQDLFEHYRDYYADGNSRWREIGAEKKADNIRDVCRASGFETVGSVLDIGAGEGAILQRLSDLEFGQEYSALEISPTGVEAIRSRGIVGLADCRIFDGEVVPYPDKRFDIAIVSHVLEHVEYERKLIYEAKRVARYVFVEVPLEDNLGLPRDFVMDKVGHINFYSPKTIRRLLQSCGLSVMAEKICNSSRAAYVYQKGRKGMISYLIKEFGLRVAPKAATQIFTYQYAALCRTSI